MNPQHDSPAAVTQHHGRILDADAHVMLLPSTVREVLSPHGDAVASWTEAHVGPPESFRTLRERAPSDVWRVKGWLALGAFDASERIEALDRMGLARQLVFPPVPWPMMHATAPGERAALSRYNDFMLGWAAASAGRLRPVVQLHADDVEETLAAARRAAAAGARAFEMPFSHPPAGVSPASADWEPLWALLAETRAPLVLHVGGGGPGCPVPVDRSFFDPRWGTAEALRARPSAAAAGVGGVGPFDVVTLHVGAEVFCTALVLGGVLERHPGLAVGVLEVGAQWVSNWVERMDRIAGGYRAYGLAPLREKPSEYVRRQVRVTPFYNEPVRSYIERDGLSDVYTFSTDFPHHEGGRNPIGRFGADLEPLGPRTVEAFFVTNGQALLPP